MQAATQAFANDSATPNNAVLQVVVERLMAFLRSTSCGGDEMMRRHIAGQIVELAEKYAPDTSWYIRVMAEVCARGGSMFLEVGKGGELCRRFFDAHWANPLHPPMRKRAGRP